MSPPGSISAMISSLKNNKIPKRDNKLGHLEYIKGVPIGKPLNFKNKMSPHEIAVFRKELSLEKRRSTILTIGIVILSLGITAYLGFYLLQ